MQVDFYHLTIMPLERVLPQIAEKVLANGERLLVVAGEPATRARIDQALWAYQPESFLPHAQTGGEDDARQPVLIAETSAAANGARHVALADGIWRDDALAFERAFHFFDDERIVEAREAWRGLADRDGVTRNYWKQNDAGRWEKVA